MASARMPVFKYLELKQFCARCWTLWLCVGLGCSGRLRNHLHQLL